MDFAHIEIQLERINYPDCWGVIDIADAEKYGDIKEGVEFQINNHQFVFGTCYKGNGAISACFHGVEGE